MSNGRGYLGFAGFAEESAAASYATASAAAWYASILNEKLGTTEGFVAPESIINSPYVNEDAPGRRTVQGSVAFVPDGYTLGWPLKWANRSLADATFPAAPTALAGSAAAGGALTAGTYLYKVASIWRLTGTSLYWFGNLSADVSITTASSNLTGSLTAWTAGTSPDANLYTLYGTAVFRTAAGGADYFYLDTVIGAATTYTDDGSKALSTTAAPTGTAYRHTNTGSNSAQKSFTAEIFIDANGKSKQIRGCKINTLDLKFQGKGPITSSINLIGQDMALIANTSPTFTTPQPFMGHNSIVYFQNQGAADAQLAQADSFTFKLDNKLQPIESQSAQRTIRALREGERILTGSMTLQCETNTWLADVLSNPGVNRHMSYHLLCWSSPQDGGTCNFSPAAGITVTFWPYMLEIKLPNFSLETFDAPLANKQQIIQTIQFARPLYDATLAADAAVYLCNDASAYADVA